MFSRHKHQYIYLYHTYYRPGFMSDYGPSTTVHLACACGKRKKHVENVILEDALLTNLVKAYGWTIQPYTENFES